MDAKHDKPLGAVQATACECDTCEWAESDDDDSVGRFVPGEWVFSCPTGDPGDGPLNYCLNCGSRLLVLNGVPHIIPAGTHEAMARWLAGMVRMKHNALNTMAPADAKLSPPSVDDWLLMARGETAGAGAGEAKGES